MPALGRWSVRCGVASPLRRWAPITSSGHTLAALIAWMPHEKLPSRHCRRKVPWSHCGVRVHRGEHARGGGERGGEEAGVVRGLGVDEPRRDLLVRHPKEPVARCQLVVHAAVGVLHTQHPVELPLHLVQQVGHTVARLR